jgi:diadenosine tetraphosphate (Ap4A) HIT family hydrolase/GNAT superfamily N-acetyltransferase
MREGRKMLIRPANESDKDSWIKLAKDVAHIFRHPGMPEDKNFHEYIEAKLSKHEALIAVDRMTNNCLGIIGFSRTHNRITWFGVFERYRGKGVGAKLLKYALNQLDCSKEITVETYREDYKPGLAARSLYHKNGFVEVGNNLFDPFGNPICKMTIKPSGKKQGESFHYKYDHYSKIARKEICPVCLGIEHPYPPVLIKEMEYSWLECYIEAQGCLFGKCHILSKVHSEHFYDMNPTDMTNFMGDVQKAAKALHKVTGAVKINYEIHGNTVPHLHVHLFPRYIDDNFPSAPIQYHMTEPSPYDSEAEFYWFVEQMRLEMLIEAGSHLQTITNN